MHKFGKLKSHCLPEMTINFCNSLSLLSLSCSLHVCAPSMVVPTCLEVLFCILAGSVYTIPTDLPSQNSPHLLS